MAFDLKSYLLGKQDKPLVGAYDLPSWLMGKAQSGDTKTITGTPPLTFVSDGSNLVDWSIAGAAGGVGEKTENLFDKDITEDIEDNCYLNQINGGKITNAHYYLSAPIAVTSEETYLWAFCITSSGDVHSSPTVGFFDANDNQIGVASHANRIKAFYFTTPANCAYIRASVYKPDISEAMLVKGTTAPSSYIPYGYKIPVTCGGVTTTIYTQSQLMDGDVLTLADTGVDIPTTDGSNTLTVGSTDQPSSMTITFKKG
jgi:hypothetical protein